MASFDNQSHQSTIQAAITTVVRLRPIKPTLNEQYYFFEHDAKRGTKKRTKTKQNKTNEKDGFSLKAKVSVKNDRDHGSRIGTRCLSFWDFIKPLFILLFKFQI